MGYCLAVVFRILGEKQFIDEFLKRFTWRCHGNFIPYQRCNEYKIDYESYGVWNKYYLDEYKIIKHKKYALSLMLKNHANISTELAGILSETILGYIKYYLGEICYVFKIWKDNFLITPDYSNELYGPAWKIQDICTKILKENKNINTNSIKATACIIERKNLIYGSGFGIYNSKWFTQFILNKHNTYQHEIMMGNNGYESDCLPKWETPYPVMKITFFGGKKEEIYFTENKFDNKYWNDYTPSMIYKHKKMNDFSVHDKILVDGLKNKKELNGLNGEITDDYDFKTERWPVMIYQKKKCYSIKSINLSRT